MGFVQLTGTFRAFTSLMKTQLSKQFKQVETSIIKLTDLI